MNQTQLLQEYARIKAKGLCLDMSRGKPGADTVELSDRLLALPGSGRFRAENGFDCRNYGVLDGIPEAKELFAHVLGVTPDELIIGGNSSLQMMYDSVARAMLVGVGDDTPRWSDNGVKWLCPVPGYDRHFAICESMGIEMIAVPTDKNGPDMDMIEELVAKDASIKGIWCVPIYSNPTGVIYSDEVVRRFANMKTAAKDFRIFWDCAYIVHHLCTHEERLLNILDECEKSGNPDRVYMFASTSKITYPGGGLALMAASKKNADFLRKHMGFQTIGSDKLNQLRHVEFFKDYAGIVAHMETIQGVLNPKFDAVLEILERELGGTGLGQWYTPKGGYFISFDGKKGTAKRTVELCKEAGVIMTGAGATFPYGNDPEDANIRIAPTFPPLTELREAMEVFCIAVKLANQ